MKPGLAIKADALLAQAMGNAEETELILRDAHRDCQDQARPTYDPIRILSSGRSYGMTARRVEHGKSFLTDLINGRSNGAMSPHGQVSPDPTNRFARLKCPGKTWG